MKDFPEKEGMKVECKDENIKPSPEDIYRKHICLKKK